MHIPLIKPDLPSLEELREPFEEILCNGKITNFGKYLKQFEYETGEYLGTETVAVSSGTTGMVFTLSALGIPPGAKVILPSFTFMATAQAVLYAGGTPLFAEVDSDLNISISDLEKLLDEHDDVAAVIAVHMYGLPARVHDLETLVAQASERRGRKIHLIFDAAHAFGSSAEGEKVGRFGDAEVFSLSVTKVLVTVEGGLVSTRKPEIAERIRYMRNYGVLANYNAHFPGSNGKMSEFHAIVGLYNLRRIDELLDARQTRACYFRRKIEKNTPFQVIPWPAGMGHTFKDFTIMIPDDVNITREHLIKELALRGIETRAYFYPPVHEQAYFSRFATRSLPVTESLSRRVLTLPFYSTLAEEEMDYMVSALECGARRNP